MTEFLNHAITVSDLLWAVAYGIMLAAGFVGFAAFDQRKRMIEERQFLREQRGPDWGNRKQRRREAAIARQKERVTL